jgi:hypothetical protein
LGEFGLRSNSAAAKGDTWREEDLGNSQAGSDLYRRLRRGDQNHNALWYLCMSTTMADEPPFPKYQDQIVVQRPPSDKRGDMMYLYHTKLRYNDQLFQVAPPGKDWWRSCLLNLASANKTILSCHHVGSAR